jgi:hypothetical protein
MIRRLVFCIFPMSGRLQDLCFIQKWLFLRGIHGRYCTAASKTALYSTAEGGNRNKGKVTTWHSHQIASLYYNKQNIYSVNTCDDTQSRCGENRCFHSSSFLCVYVAINLPQLKILFLLMCSDTLLSITRYSFLILKFCPVLNVICFLLGDSTVCVV